MCTEIFMQFNGKKLSPPPPPGHDHVLEGRRSQGDSLLTVFNSIFFELFVDNFILSIFSKPFSDFGSLSNMWVLVSLDLPMTLHIYGRVYIIFSNYNVE